jgi:hypothetical protein
MMEGASIAVDSDAFRRTFVATAVRAGAGAGVGGDVALRRIVKTDVVDRCA